MGAELSLRFKTEEDVSDAAKTIAESLKKLAGQLGKTEDEAKGAAKGLDEAEKSTLDLGKAVVVANQALELMAKAWDVVSRVGSVAIDYVKEGTVATMAAERGYKALEAALGPAAAQIARLTEEIERKTGADADQMQSVAAMLGALGLTTEEIEQAIPALSAWADVTGKDMEAGVRKLQAALEQGKLAEEIEAFAQFTEEAAAMAETFGGRARILSQDLDNLQEAAGASVTQSTALTEALGLTSQFVRELTEQVEEAGPVIGDTLVLALQAATLAGQAFAFVLADIAASIGQIMLLSAEMNEARAGVEGFFGDEEDAAWFQKQAEDQRESVKTLQAFIDQMRVASDRAGTLREQLAALRSDGEAGTIRMPGLDLRDPTPTRVFRGRKAKDDEPGTPEQLGDEVVFDIPEMEHEEAGRAEVRAHHKGWRDEEAKAARERAALAKEHAKDVAEAAKKTAAEELRAEQEMKRAGESAGLTYLSALGQAIHGDSEGALKSAIGGLFSLLGFAAGGPFGAAVGGQVGGIVSGFLRDGGPGLQVRLPKMRRGGVIPDLFDLDADGKVVEMHAGEVAWTAQAVAKNGGIDAVARQNDPLEPPMRRQGGGRGGGQPIYVAAFAPHQAAEAIREMVGPGLTEVLSNHDSQLLEGELRRTAQMPRWR